VSQSRTLYDVLGVRPDADDPTIKRAWRLELMRTHPDRGGTTVGLIEVQAAYEVLSDPHRRAGYDAQLQSSAEGGPAQVGALDDVAKELAALAAQLGVGVDQLTAVFQRYVSSDGREPSGWSDADRDTAQRFLRVLHGAPGHLCAAMTEGGLPCFGERVEGGPCCAAHTVERLDDPAEPMPQRSADPASTAAPSTGGSSAGASRRAALVLVAVVAGLLVMRWGLGLVGSDESSSTPVASSAIQSGTPDPCPSAGRFDAAYVFDAVSLTSPSSAPGACNYTTDAGFIVQTTSVVFDSLAEADSAMAAAEEVWSQDQTPLFEFDSGFAYLGKPGIMGQSIAVYRQEERRVCTLRILDRNPPTQDVGWEVGLLDQLCPAITT
jgi:DnaJ domain